MTHAQCISWITKTIADYQPVSDMDRGEMTSRLGQTMTAAHGLSTGTVFGFSIPDSVRSEVITAAQPELTAALHAWLTWLSENFGSDGSAFYNRMATNHGLVAPPARTLTADPAICNAVQALRAALSNTRSATAYGQKTDWLEPDQSHAFAIAPPASDASQQLAEFELHAAALPAALEALYCELDGLWVGGVAGPGGAQAFSPKSEYFVIAPLAVLLDRSLDRDDTFIALNQDPDSFRSVLLDIDDGAVYRATKLDDGPPTKIATSLPQYLELLASTYGTHR